MFTGQPCLSPWDQTNHASTVPSECPDLEYFVDLTASPTKAASPTNAAVKSRQEHYVDLTASPKKAAPNSERVHETVARINKELSNQSNSLSDSFVANNKYLKDVPVELVTCVESEKVELTFESVDSLSFGEWDDPPAVTE